MRVLFAVAALFFSSAAAAQTPEQLAASARSAAVGWDLYEHDQAAWHGTDAMLAEVRDPVAEGFVGYITERTAEGVQLLFVRGSGDDMTVAYRALYRDGALRERGRANLPLSDLQRRIFRARALATSTPIDACAANYNTVTIPRATPSADGVDIDVYLMPASTRDREVPFGGHYRLGIDAAAGLVREMAACTRSCLTLQAEPDDVSLMVTQIIGEAPTEIHVFESLTWRIPVYVGVNSEVWLVDGRDVRYVSAQPSTDQR